jgi:hypothetical protein
MSVTALNRNGSPYIDRACPSWGCDLPYGHSWSDGWDYGEQGRGHGRDLGNHVHLFAQERVDEPNDESLPSTTDSPTISLYGDGLERSEMTAEQARQHAAVVRQAADKLLEAADMLDRIEAATA